MLGFIKSLLFKSKSTKKVKKQTPLTEVNFINYYPNLNNVEVFFGKKINLSKGNRGKQTLIL
jgi:hypothetical protein